MQEAQSIQQQVEQARSNASALRIIHCAPSFSVAENEVKWTAFDALKGLLCMAISTTDDLDDNDLPALLEAFGNSLRIHPIFEYSFPSDEEAKAYALTLRGTPFLVHRRVGDQSDYSNDVDVVDVKIAQEVVAVLMASRIQRSLLGKGRVEPALQEEAFFKGNSYVRLMEKGMLVIESPRRTHFAAAFKQDPETHPAFLLMEGGKVLKATQFLGWLNERCSIYDLKGKDFMARFMTAEGEIVHDSRLVVLSLTDAPDYDTLKKLAKAVFAPSYWHAEKLHPAQRNARPMVTLRVHKRGHFFNSTADIVFSSSDTAQEAAQSFFDSCQSKREGVPTEKSPDIQALVAPHQFSPAYFQD